MINVLQIVVVLFVVFAWSRTYLRFRERKISFAETFFWSTIWGGLLVLVFVPTSTAFFSSLLGITPGLNVAIYVSILLLLYLVFRLYVKLDEVSKAVTVLVREFALQKKKK